ARLPDKLVIYLCKKPSSMSSYYTIIDGQRYEASLISNAKFRLQGSGKITVAEAQELWQIAQDGGRITEIEENTLQYLLDNFTFTPAAKTWLEAEMAKEVEETMSYYQIIDGLRYDRKILEEAERSVAGAGDGRISQADAERLLPLFGDMGDITIIEERTLQYLLEQYNWTTSAQDWFLEKVNRISKQSSLGPMLQHIMQSEYGFQTFPFDYFPNEALQQLLDQENKVSLPDALRQALDSLINDTSEKSFTSIGYSDEPPKEFLEGGRLVLLPGNISSEPALSSFPAPNQGESIRKNWIFGLELFDLTDDIFWMIVARDGSKPAYNYIGGPNVGDIYHIVEEENYFTIIVKSCDIPYPDITVEVQDPDGKFIVNKSNDQGEVLVNGPAGTYSIYASDGWSYQSKSFEWDGTGKDQTKNIILDC
ncbi:MAG: hypothetical protein AAFU60_14885, partial [Bacteroidota bacterium]